MHNKFLKRLQCLSNFVFNRLLLITLNILILSYSCAKDENAAPQFVSMENPGPVDYVSLNNAWLGWDFIDEDGDFLTYDLYLSTVNPPDSIADEALGDNKHKVTRLHPLTTYYWKVVAKDPWGSTSESGVMTFKTRNKPDYLDLFTGKYYGMVVRTTGYSADCCRDTLDSLHIALIGRIRKEALILEIDTICEFEAHYLKGAGYPENYFESINSSSPPDYFNFYGDSIYCRYKKKGVLEAFHFYGKKRL